MVEDKWKGYSTNLFPFVTQVFMFKLKRLKHDVLQWEKSKKKEDGATLILIERELDVLSNLVDDELFSEERRNMFFELLASKHKILLQEEETWQLKSQAVWIQSGDKNPKFFQNFANHRRISNSIWDLEDQNGNLLSDYDSISSNVISYFKKIFARDNSLSIESQLQVIKLFPRMF